MGIPKFFRWMSERYPGLCMTAKEYQLPAIDNFYLDMNGIIHNCSHPCDGDVHFRISEEEMFEDIFNYVETLFKIIKPNKYFFLAVDGVAPRAKMNQQRGRRFRSAKEAAERETAAVRKGDILPTEQRFDSNCITPGTTFMIKLNEALKKFIETKLTTDPSWQHVKVILSGHETPGEGEHKIMDFIRFERSQPGYDPNTKHCLYGLDTDLIMLGLASHEPYFMLLREEIKFNKKPYKVATSQRVDSSKISFNVLYLSLLRDYIERDFTSLKPPFKFDLEATIDDWILLCFLVGNDFIPHIPHFHIHQSALPRIFEVYKSVLPELDGYLNENGFLNLERFKKFASKLSLLDVTMVPDSNNKVDNNHEKHRRSNGGRPSQYGSPKVGVHSFTEAQLNKSIKVCADGHFMDLSDEDFDSDEKFPGEPPLRYKKRGVMENFKRYKLDYYRTKFKVKPDEETIRNITHEYVRALQWNLHYYYHGCVSWGWYYPFHYAPFISDVKNFISVDLKFERGEPFKPFEQLLAVLPPASSNLLPSIYKNLVMSSSSPLAEFFPADIEYDLNGKQNEWEAVALAPFIDEKILIGATTLCNLFLTEAERRQNVLGPHCLYECKLMRVGPQGQKPRVVAKIKRTQIGLDGFHLSTSKIKFGLLKEPKSKRASDKDDCMGFPTLAVIEQKFKYTPKSTNNNVNRFRSNRIKL